MTEVEQYLFLRRHHHRLTTYDIIITGVELSSISGEAIISMFRPTRLLLLQLLIMSFSSAFALTSRSRHITCTKRYTHNDTFLDATKRGEGNRGGGQQRDGEAISATTTKTSSIVNKLSSITSSVTTSKTAQGRLILLFVAFLYGTLNVTLRGVYATEGPPAASVLSLVRQLLSVATFIPIIVSEKNNKSSTDTEESSSKVEEEGVRPMWMSALELALWNFGAQGFCTAGLLYSSAARASFLTQTSVVMTPLISALAGEKIKSQVWGGCGIALGGLYLISTAAVSGDVVDDSTVIDSAMSNQGDILVLLGALSWSTYIFRTSKLANSYKELDLQFTKSAMLAVMYGGWFVTTAMTALSNAGTSFFQVGWIEALTPLWSGWNSALVWVLLIYSAVGPGVVADVLQQKGQQETSASESNIILTMESVFAAVCAFVLLGEVSSLQEIFGGMLIVVAAILASK